MIKLHQLRQQLWDVVAVVVVSVTLSSCVSTGQRSYAPGIADTDVKPRAGWAPYPVASLPVNPNAAAIAKVVVPSVKVHPRAKYRKNNKPLQVSIPDFEIPTTGKGGGKKSVWAPGPYQTEATEGFTPEPLSWEEVDLQFLSTDFDDNGTYNSGYRFIPPDNHAAAGPNHLVNVVNTTISFHQKDGTLDNRYGLESFFSSLSPLTATFDPKVLYDQYEGRWVVITMEKTSGPDTSRMFVAVSDDADPNGTWYFSEFDTAVNVSGTDYWADYPGFAVDEEAVYITSNLFSFASGSWGGVRVWILEKGVDAGGFYDSGGSLVVSELDPYAGGGIDTTTQVSHMFGPSPAAGVGVFLVSYSGINDGTNEYVQVVRLDDPLSSPSFTQQYISLGDLEALAGDLPGMPQAGSSELISSNDRRALNAVWRDGYLWITMTIDPNSGVDSGQATAMWVKLDTSNLANLTLADSGTIGGEDIATGTFTTFPSIAVNADEDVVVGFSASAPTIYAGAYFATREVSDPAGFMGNSVTVKEGVDHYYRAFGGSRNRWGDYSATVVDPADGCFWVYNQWADTRGTLISGEDGRWGTAYAKTCNTPDNLPPDAVDDTASVDEDDSVNINVLANDSDPEGDDFSVSTVADPPNGSTSINPDDTIAYSPDPNFNGTDNFTYTIEDTFGGTDDATVTVTVNPINDLPDAVDDSASTKDEDPVDIDVLLNDTEVDGEALSISSVTQGGKGSVTNHGSYVTYQPNTGLTLPTTDTFDYTAWDSQPGSTDTATVTVTIDPKVPPTASFTFSVTGLSVDFTDTSSDTDGTIDAWSWDFGDSGNSTAQNPSHVYASDGQYAVTLTVTDNHGLTDQASQPVSLITAPDALTATPDTIDSVELNWNDNSTVETGFEVERSPGGADSWTNIATVAADVTTFADNADLADGSDYDYRVRAAGPDGDSGYSATASITAFECATSKTFNGGEWYQFALACDPGPYNTVTNIFDGPHPLVYRWDASAMSYARLGPSDTLSPQMGYWVNFYYTTDYTQSGYDNTNADIPLVTDSANGRSNLLGFHGTGSISWPDTLVVDGPQVKTLLEADPLDKGGPDRACDVSPPTNKCLMSRILRIWGGAKAAGSYQVYDPDVPGQQGTVVPLDGLWVKAFKSGVELRLPDPAAPATKTTMPASAATNTETKDSPGKGNKGGNKGDKKDPKSSGATWFIRLIAEQGSLRDPGNTLGQKPGSIDGLDSRDLEEPLPFGETYLSVLFTNPLFREVDWGFTTDFRTPTDPPEGEWPFVVKTSDTETPISLSWASDGYDLSGAWLLDRQTGTAVSVASGDGYTFQPTDKESLFVFFVEQQGTTNLGDDIGDNPGNGVKNE